MSPFIQIEGFKEAAEKFSVEANIKPPMDLDQLDERIRIRTAIQNGQFQEAMRMVTALHPEILDDNSQLYFHLQVMMPLPSNLLSALHALTLPCLYHLPYSAHNSSLTVLLLLLRLVYLSHASSQLSLLISTPHF